MEQTLSDKIRACRDGVVRNPYQGPDKRVVFVCSMGILRSATAARLYAHKHNTRAAGTDSDALVQLSPTLVAWADEIVFVNDYNYQKFKHSMDDWDLFNSLNIRVLDIPDVYEHMHPKMVEEFHKQYEDIN